MQALKRATVMGAPTWGGAHPASGYRLGDHLSARIPDYRTISPITHTHWEGVSVKPDVAVASSGAMAAATALLQRQLQPR
jgi:C-terminal processing protease CtpA/Prc